MKTNLYGYWDVFNEEFVRTHDDAQKRKEGGNRLIPLYSIDEKSAADFNTWVNDVGEKFQECAAVLQKEEIASGSGEVVQKRLVEVINLCINLSSSPIVALSNRAAKLPEDRMIHAERTVELFVTTLMKLVKDRLIKIQTRVIP